MLAALALAALVIGGVGATVTVSQEAQLSSAQQTEPVAEVIIGEPVETSDR